MSAASSSTARWNLETRLSSCVGKDFRSGRPASLFCSGKEHPHNFEEVVLTAVRRTGYALRYATPELRGDQEIVLAAVQQSGEALIYATPELREQLKREGY